MSPSRRPSPRRPFGLILLLVLMTLSACANSSQVATRAKPGQVTPCVRQSIAGLWSCVNTKRLVWLESDRHRAKAWLGSRVRR